MAKPNIQSEDDLKQAVESGKVQSVDLRGAKLSEGKKSATEGELPTPQDLVLKPEDYIIVLTALRRMKRHLTAAPDYVPKNFIDQIAFVDDGAGNQSVYFYINKTWRGVDLPLT